MQTVAPTTLPHIVLKGAVAWERSKSDYPQDTAPAPWLALLLLTENELVAPAEALSLGVKPSGTKTFTLPLELVNAPTVHTKFCHKKEFARTEVTTRDGAPATADFIFIKSPAFRMYFDRQDAPPAAQPQTAADLGRYKFLSVMTDTGVDDGTGHANAKLSTLIGHRSRPYGLSEKAEKVHAHLVSIEDLENRINWETVKADASATVALVSLFSWTFTWDKNDADNSLEMFEHRARPQGTRALSIPLARDDDRRSGNAPAPSPQTATLAGPPQLTSSTMSAMPWVKERLEEGYTIVRHRDIAGEASMALYRGPLTPRPTRRPPIGPSMHGTDLQIIDVSAQILDLSYSTAWELGRSLAGRNAKFSKAMSSLRRQLCMHAVTKAKSGDREQKPLHQPDDVMQSVLSKLDELFKKPMADTIKGLPLNGDEDKASRWQIPAHTATTTATAPESMTHAKLRRHLESFVQDWILGEARKLCKKNADLRRCELPDLAVVFNWIVNNLMSLKLVPATYLFPDPAVIVDESINCFLVDDVWVDAMVDGAMSLANTIGGGDDPVRDQIRRAFNVYLTESEPGVVSIGSSGFVLKSVVLESFPDLAIKIKTKNEPQVTLDCPFKAKNDNMMICLVERGPNKELADYIVEFKLPPHQLRFSMGPTDKDHTTFDFDLEPYLVTPEQGTNLAEIRALGKSIEWSNQGQVLKPAGATFVPLWSFETGILTPHIVADMTDKFCNEVTQYPLKKVAVDSRSLYLVTQLADKERSVFIEFLLREEGQKYTKREIFPENEPVAPDTRDAALLHTPQARSSGPAGGVTKSWFTKQAFSQEFPGESIPAESNKVQNLVFSIKATDQEALPADIEVAAIEVCIPLGEDPDDLLDHTALLPAVRTLGSLQQWIAALTRRKRAATKNKREGQELVVHLKPRGGKGATLVKGLDASFVLLRATVNGVMGSDVEIRVTETYERAQTVTEGRTSGSVVGNAASHAAGRATGDETRTTVTDSWMLVKE
jgi:hypothetical protein